MKWTAIIMICGAACVEPGDPQPAAELPTATACFQATAAKSGTSGLAAVVIHGDEVVYARGFGTIRPNGPDVTTRTRFRLASGTKMLTSAAALSLVADGKVGLDAPVQNLVPQLAAPGAADWRAQVTLGHLLSNTSGLRDASDPDGPHDDAALASTWADPMKAAPFMVAPGTFFNYANTGFSLAGLVAEKAAGMPYAKVVEQRVLAPLGMDRTTFSIADVEADGDFAYGLTSGSPCGAEQKPSCYDNAALRPAGWVWTTADDLGQFARFVLHGDEHVMSSEMHDAMQTPRAATPEFGPHMQYGYGLFVSDYIQGSDVSGHPQLRFGVKVLQHAGNLPGYTSLTYMVPDHDVAVAIVANGDSLDLTSCAAAAVVDLVGNELPSVSPPPAEFRPDPAHFGDYVGVYADILEAVGRVTIARDANGGLTIDAPALDTVGIPYQHALVPGAQDNFFWVVEGTPVQLTGRRTAGGTAVEYLSNRGFVARREAQ